MADLMTAGRLLKAARIAAGLTQRELAEKLYMKFQNLGAWERGSERISEKKIAALRQLLPGLDMQQLQTALAWDADSLVADDLEATQQMMHLVAYQTGTITVLSGKEAGFSNQLMTNAAVTFLENPKNSVVFIIVPRFEDVIDWSREADRLEKMSPEVVSSMIRFWPNTYGGHLIDLRNELSGGNVKAEGRISFLCLRLPDEHPHTTGVCIRLMALSRLLHPLAVTMLFEPNSNSTPRAGIIYIRTGLRGMAQKGEYAWLRLSPDYLAQLASVLQVTLKATDRARFFRDAFEPDADA
jgi:transcriptional regulator with XRE-family HTH domain